MRKLIERSITIIKRPSSLIVAALVLAATAGMLTAVALGTSNQEPGRTVTVNIPTGSTGPAGPTGPQGEPGPPGPPGGTTCPAGYSYGALVINAPGGQVQLATCLLD